MASYVACNFQSFGHCAALRYQTRQLLGSCQVHAFGQPLYVNRTATSTVSIVAEPTCQRYSSLISLIHSWISCLPPGKVPKAPAYFLNLSSCARSALLHSRNPMMQSSRNTKYSPEVSHNCL